MHKTIGLYIALLLCILSSCAPQTTHEKQPIIPYDSLRNGDILFRQGCSYTSNIVISGQDNCAYSHVGLVHKSDSGWCVIHAVNDEHDTPTDFDRVKIEKIEKFLSPARAKKGEFMHSWVSDSLATVMSKAAIEWVNDSVRFDAAFDSEDHSRLYCTEFIYLLYKNIGEDITEGRRTRIGILCFPQEIIFPDDIYRNKKLKSYYKF